MKHAIRRVPSAALLISTLLACSCAPKLPEDLQTAYDVQKLRLDLTVRPEAMEVDGVMALTAKVTADGLDRLLLDFEPKNNVQGAKLIAKSFDGATNLDGQSIKFKHENGKITLELGRRYRIGEEVSVAVQFLSTGLARVNEQGLMFVKTPDNRPWIGVSCQLAGSQSWFPSKSETWYPEDRFDQLFVNLDVPEGLVGVSNGRLLSRSKSGGRELSRWQHDYPCLNYAVTFCAAPYVEVSRPLKLPGLEAPVTWVYYVLPQYVKQAELEFAAAPKLLEIFSELFGPYPFPKSKICLVQVPYRSMEHSTVLGYGSTFPTWLKKHGQKDPQEWSNKFYDYALVHEIAHEWFGNAVTVADWGHFWLSEGFATHAEMLYLERTQGPRKVERYVAQFRPGVDGATKLYRGEGVHPKDAYVSDLYWKGAFVLDALRQYVNDDPKWFQALREFSAERRFKPTTTEDFRAVLERVTGKDWKQFFDEWFYGVGHPMVTGTVRGEENGIAVDLQAGGTSLDNFHFPLEVSWIEAGRPKRHRLWLKPGPNQTRIPTDSKPMNISLPTLDRLLYYASVKVE